MSVTLGSKDPIGEDISIVLGNLAVSSDEPDENSTPKSLSDMPEDVVGLIIDRSDYKEQLILRLVSKSLLSLVDERKKQFISVHYRMDHICCQYDHKLVVFAGDRWDGCEHDEKCKEAEVIRCNNYEDKAWNDLKKTLINPRLQLETLRFEYRVHNIKRKRTWEENEWIEKCHTKIESLLMSLNHQVSTRTCEVRAATPAMIFAVLPYLKPGVLKKIVLNKGGCGNLFGIETMTKLVSLDQWKQAKDLGLRFALEGFPLEYASHFERLYIHDFWRFADARLDRQLERLRMDLCGWEKFESCFIDDVAGLSCQYGSLARNNGTGAEYVRHYAIPDSDDYFEFHFHLVLQKESITIRKKKGLKNVSS